MRALMILVSVSLIGLFQSACSTGNCRQLGRSETVQPAPTTAQGAAANMKSAKTTPESSSDTKKTKGSAAAANGQKSEGTDVTRPKGEGQKSEPSKRDETIVVYKYDGSLQCGMGEAISVETMAKELSEAGIKVFSSEKKPDGLMHIQVCGQPTGMVNAYKISASQLKDAEGRGFKKWSFE